MPLQSTCRWKGGHPFNPEVSWTPHGGPVALRVVDPDAPSGTFVHWEVPWIAPWIDSLPEGMSIEAGRVEERDGGEIELVQGLNSAGGVGYYPACPPPGTGSHRYVFEMWRLHPDSPAQGAAEVSHFDDWLQSEAIDGESDVVVLTFP